MTKLEQDLKALLEGKQEKDELLEAVKKKMEDEVPPSNTPEVADPAVAPTEPVIPAEVSVANPIDPDAVPSEVEGGKQVPIEPDAVDPAVVPPVEGEDEPEEKDDEDDKKKNVKEDIDSVVAEEFSEEFQAKALAMFEAKLAEKETEIRQKVEEEFKAKELALTESFDGKTKDQSAIFEERIAELENELGEKIDGYVGQVAEQWMNDNAVAIESGVKTEIAESFINDVKRVFETYNIEIPEAGKLTISTLQEEKTELSKEVESLKSMLAESQSKLDALNREKLIEESIKDLTEMDKSKFKTLMEGFVFESDEALKNKIDSIKESFFNKDGKRNNLAEEFSKQTMPVVESTSEIIDVNPRMQAYLKVL